MPATANAIGMPTVAVPTCVRASRTTDPEPIAQRRILRAWLIAVAGARERRNGDIDQRDRGELNGPRNTEKFQESIGDEEGPHDADQASHAVPEQESTTT